MQLREARRRVWRLSALRGRRASVMHLARRVLVNIKGDGCMAELNVLPASLTLLTFGHAFDQPLAVGVLRTGWREAFHLRPRFQPAIGGGRAAGRANTTSSFLAPIRVLIQMCRQQPSLRVRFCPNPKNHDEMPYCTYVIRGAMATELTAPQYKFMI